MGLQSIAECGEALRKGELLATFCEIVEFIRELSMMECLRHGEKRGDADPTGDEDRSKRIASQWKVVAWLGDRQHVALADAVMQELRSTTRQSFALYPDDIGTAFARPVGQ